MANVVSGNTVSSSAQLGADVVTAPAIKDGEVKSAEILDESILSGDIKDGEIVNADINSAAAIADTKLAQITTAGKVSGAALTSLSSIPAGAGVIPSANLPANGMVLLRSASGTSTTTTGHNMDSVAISGLTALDSIKVVCVCSAITQIGGALVPRQTTDIVDLISLNGGTGLAAGKSFMGEFVIKQEQHSNTCVTTLLTETGTNLQVTGTSGLQVGRVAGNSVTYTTAWTGSWTLALYNYGVTAGGTCRWSWSVYKMLGQ